MNPNLEALLAVACFYLWMQVSTTLHEFAHFWAAKALGMRPRSVTIGRGARLLDFVHRGVHYSLSAAPMGGYVRVERPDPEGFDGRGILLAAAGPACHVFWACLLASQLPAVLGARLQLNFSGFWLFVFWYEMGCLLLNLYPRYTEEEGLSLPNDGMQILHGLRGEARPSLRQRLQWLAEAVTRYDPGYDFEKGWLGRADTSGLNQFGEANRLLRAGRFEEAITAYERLLKNESLSPGERAFFLDQLACLPILQGYHKALDRGLAWAEQAHALLPNSPTIAGTYGSLLIEKGRLNEGIRLLQPLTKPHQASWERLLASAYLAKAALSQGNTEICQAWLAHAETIEPKHPLLLRLRRQLGS